jgi:DeoR/GlpR family transcriptional regulator of sugar metabolism
MSNVVVAIVSDFREKKMICCKEFAKINLANKIIRKLQNTKKIFFEMSNICLFLGATTFNIIPLSLMTLSILAITITIEKHDSQHAGTLHNHNNLTLSISNNKPTCTHNNHMKNGTHH